MTSFEQRFAEWELEMQTYRERLKAKQTNVIGDNSWYVSQFWRWLKMNEILPTDLKPRHFVEYCLALESGQLCKATDSYKLSTLAAFRAAALTWVRDLHKRGKLLLNPFVDFSPKHPDKRAGRPVLTQAQMKRLLDLPNTNEPTGLRDRTIFEIAYGSGLRISELAALTLQSVDLGERSLHLKDTKNGWDRTVPLTYSSCHYLRRYLKESRPFMYRPRVGSSLWLSFLKRPFLVYGIKDLARRYRTQAQFHFSMHDLRHACATHLLEGGASLAQIASLLGHEYIDSTQIYTRVRVEELRRVHAASHPRG